MGQTITELGLVISEALHIQQSDWWGNMNILHNVKAGEIFGLAFAAVRSTPLENDVIAERWMRTFFFLMCIGYLLSVRKTAKQKSRMLSSG